MKTILLNLVSCILIQKSDIQNNVYIFFNYKILFFLNVVKQYIYILVGCCIIML